jgi:hypothetical protein
MARADDRRGEGHYRATGLRHESAGRTAATLLSTTIHQIFRDNTYRLFVETG